MVVPFQMIYTTAACKGVCRLVTLYRGIQSAALIKHIEQGDPCQIIYFSNPPKFLLVFSLPFYLSAPLIFKTFITIINIDKGIALKVMQSYDVSLF